MCADDMRQRLPSEQHQDSAVPELAALLARVARQDHAAFESLYRATSRRLFSVALLLLRRRDLAEDVVQEAYVRIWRHASGYDPARGLPWAWLTQIVRFAAIDRLRADRLPVTDLAAMEETLAAPANPVAERLDLTHALAGLNADSRAALLLSFLYGYTNQEVARRLGVPDGTAKSWIRRGAMRLREQLEA